MPDVPGSTLSSDHSYCLLPIALRHADAVALGEADETWARIVNDAARGELKDIYAPLDETGKERKPSLK